MPWYSPDGTYIASSDDTGAVCIFGQQKNLMKIIRCHEETVNVVAFSSNSKILLTACMLGNIRLFIISSELESKKNLCKLKNENYIIFQQLVIYLIYNFRSKS